MRSFAPIMGVMRTFLTALILLSAATATAQDTGSGSEEPELRWALGPGIIVSPRPFVGSEPQIFPVPVFELDYGRWFVQGIRGGYRVVDSEKLTVNALASVQFAGLEPGDSPFLEGMAERGPSMDGGVELTYRSRPVGFRLSAVTDVLGRSNGQEVGAQAVTGAPLGPVLVLAGIGPRWVSGNRVDYYYGVRPSEATAVRPAYQGGSTLGWDLGVTGLVRFDSGLSLFLLLNREAFGSEIRESPIVEREAATSFVAFLTYQF